MERESSRKPADIDFFPFLKRGCSCFPLDSLQIISNIFARKDFPNLKDLENLDNLMRRLSLINIIVYLIALAAIGIAYYVIWQRDDRIVGHDARYHSTMDTAAMYFSDNEIRSADRFSDSTLPALQELGLITRFDQREFETVITASGPMWRERSEFFKESFLNQLMVHNKVRGRPSAVRIVDPNSGKLLAQITVSDRKEIYE